VGYIWDVLWYPPSFGDIFATAGYDGFVRLWKATDNLKNIKVVAEQNLSSSGFYLFCLLFFLIVNKISFAGEGEQAVIAAALSNGTVAFLTAANLSVLKGLGVVHPDGVTSVAWEKSNEVTRYLI
jgi:WD40 repeat protein